MPDCYIIYDSEKRPRSPYTGQICDPHDPAHRSDRATADVAVLLGLGEGVGYVFTAGCGQFFIDLDHCLQSDGTWSQQARDICAALQGCYIEVSRSGTGLHIIGAGTLPTGHRTRGPGIEVYTSGRYCALTGRGATGSMTHSAQAALDSVYSCYMPAPSAQVDAEWTEGPCAEWSGPEDDQDLIVKMLASRPSAAAAFGGKLGVAQLWEGEHCGDQSSSDAALMQHLAFWTGKDCPRMERLFSLSGLAKRDKWDERPDYRRGTVLHAVGLCHTVLGQGRSEPGEPVAVERLEGDAHRIGGIMTATMQREHFQGCVYVTDQHAALMPDGRIVKPEQFRVLMGGYLFCQTDDGKTTKSAWEAFTESHSYSWPKVASTCFRPEHPAGTIIEEEGRKLVNTYVPVQTERAGGDVSRFTGHVARLLPDPNDQAILLAYMAAIVQHPGEKFQWAPLIQGVEGNGKTLLFSCVERAVGQCYTHFPAAADISNKFNGWLQGKLFVGVEEIYTSDRQEVVDTLKTLITNRRIEVQRKGADQITTDNRANFMLSSNHKDAVRKTENDRRYAVFYTAQQEAGDIRRDGMGGSYFPDLYRWLRLGGYAAVTDYLHAYQIPDELNPATLCHRAPVTSSTGEAVQASVGAIEQEILEACDTGRYGFAGGWISSHALDELLESKRMASKLPRNRRREVLRSLGYVYHPSLPDGRVHNPLAHEGRPRLYVKVGHLSCNMRSGAEIVRMYSEAQIARPPALERAA